MSKDPKIDMPTIGPDGISDLVFINTTDGQACAAWFDTRDGYWHDEYQNTFGDVRRWDYPPKDFIIDSKFYGGLA